MAENTLVPPRNNPYCYGHEAVEEDLLNALRAGRMPHTLLFEGPKGIGKATFAYRFARFVLTKRPDEFLNAQSFEISPDTPSFKRISSGGHADLCVVEAGRNKDGQKNKFINVDDIRKAIAFSRKTAGEGGWRIILVDSADELNKNSANALLKLIEEPPAFSTVILVSSNKGKLPVTLLSRCQRYSFLPLSECHLAKAMSHIPSLALSQDALHLASGSAGRAAHIAFGNGVAIYRGMLTFMSMNINHQGEKAIYGLQSMLDNNPDNFEAFCGYFDELIGKYIAFKMGDVAQTHFNEGEIFEKMDQSRLVEWVNIWQKASSFLQEAKIYNLDWRTTLNAIVHIFEKRV